MKKLFLIVTLLWLSLNVFAQNEYKIGEMTHYNSSTGVADSNGKKCILRGIVHSQNLGFSFGPGGGYQFSLIDSTGAVWVNSQRKYNYTPNMGDSVWVRGTIIQNTQTVGNTVFNIDSLRFLSSSYKLNTPTVLTTLSEKYESSPVKLMNLRLSTPSQWTKGQGFGGFNIQVTDGTYTYNVRISNLSDLYTMNAPTGTFNLSGIERQNDQTAPLLDAYYLMPRTAAVDLEILTSKPVLHHKIKEIKGYNTFSGVADSIGVVCFIKGIVQSPSFSTKGLEVSIYDNTGAIFIENSNKLGYYVQMGDSIELYGSVGQLRGLTVFNVDTVYFISSGHTVHSSTIVSGALGESTESELIQLQNVSIVDKALWDTTSFQNKQGFTISVTNGTTVNSVRIDRDCPMYFKPCPQTNFDVTGLGYQNDFSPPNLLDGYYLMPRDTYDFAYKAAVYVKVPIYVVKGYLADGTATAVGGRVWLKGIVSSPNFSSGGLTFSIYDKTGAITVASGLNATGYNVTRGDSINVKGIIAQSNGLTIIVPDSITKISGAHKVKNPLVVTSLDESTESAVVKLEVLNLVTPSQWDTTLSTNKAGFIITVSNGTDQFNAYISRNTDLYKSPAPTVKFNLAGIGSQYDPTKAYFDNYLLLPRDVNDLELGGVSSVERSKENDLLNIYPNPVNNYLHFTSNSEIKSVVISELTGKKIMELTQPLTNNSIDISKLSNGIYLFRATAINGVVNTTFIKE